MAVKSCQECGISGHLKTGWEVEFFQITDQFGEEWFIPVGEKDERHVKDILKHYKTFILTLPGCDRRPHWIEYFEMRDTYKPNLDYSYCSTVHKAQGSQWKHVYIDYSNIYHSSYAIRDRLLYTAVSRMSERLFIIREPSLLVG
jgi:hypothetical protein